jgi:hypothetical protein
LHNSTAAGPGLLDLFNLFIALKQPAFQPFNMGEPAGGTSPCFFRISWMVSLMVDQIACAGVCLYMVVEFGAGGKNRTHSINTRHHASAP